MRWRAPAPTLVTLPMASEIVREPYHRTLRGWRDRGWKPVGRWGGTLLFDSREIRKWRAFWKGGRVRDTLGPGPDGKLTWITLRKLRKMAPSCPRFPPIPIYKWGPADNAPYIVRVKDVHDWLSREKHLEQRGSAESSS